MARPKKPIDFENELLRIEAQITRHRRTIEELEEARRAIQQQQEQQEVSRLYEFYKSTGLSIDEIIGKLETMTEEKNEMISA